MKKHRTKTDMDAVLRIFDCFCEACERHKEQETFVMDCPFCGEKSAFEVLDSLCDAKGQCAFCRESIHVKWDSSSKT